jgi:hypothetical protein
MRTIKVQNPRRKRGLIEKSYGLLDVRLNEPQEFIQIAGSGGEDVRGVFVFGFTDRFTYVVGDNRISVRQLFQVILNGVDIQRVTFQRRFAVDDLRCT